MCIIGFWNSTYIYIFIYLKKKKYNEWPKPIQYLVVENLRVGYLLKYAKGSVKEKIEGGMGELNNCMTLSLVTN